MSGPWCWSHEASCCAMFIPDFDNYWPSTSWMGKHQAVPVDQSWKSWITRQAFLLILQKEFAEAMTCHAMGGDRWSTLSTLVHPCPPVSNPVQLSNYRSVYLSICPSVYLSIYLPIYLSTYLFIYLSIYLPIHQSIHPSIHPSMHACMHACMHPHVHTYI